jgi:hypothetical protein
MYEELAREMLKQQRKAIAKEALESAEQEFALAIELGAITLQHCERINEMLRQAAKLYALAQFRSANYEALCAKHYARNPYELEAV